MATDTLTLRTPVIPAEPNGSGFDVDHMLQTARAEVLLGFLRYHAERNPNMTLGQLWKEIDTYDELRQVVEDVALGDLFGFPAMAGTPWAPPETEAGDRFRPDPTAAAKAAAKKPAKPAAKKAAKKAPPKSAPARAAPKMNFSTYPSSTSAVYKHLRVDRGRSSSELAELAGLSKRTTVRALTELHEAGAARTEGTGRMTRWFATGGKRK
jgi:hypothetical protein